MYGKTHKGKHAQEGNMYRETHVGKYTHVGTHRDIHALRDIFAWGNTYTQGDTCMEGHLQGMHAPGHMHGDSWGYPWGHMHRGNTQRENTDGKTNMHGRIYTQGDTYA
jgi:hypothetical protein